MSNPFFKKSKEIANDFLQSIVFLDDRAHSISENSNQDSIHDLDVIKITKLFSKSKCFRIKFKVFCHKHNKVNK
jgi:hypothetical protein